MKKYIALLFTGAVIFACQNNTNTNVSSSEEPDTSSKKQPPLIEESDQPGSVFVLKENSIISDYATCFLETKVYNSPDEMVAGGGDHYYETIDVKNSK